MWQYVSGLKKRELQYMHIHGMTALMMCSIQSELATWRNPKHTNHFNLMAMIYSVHL